MRASVGGAGRIDDATAADDQAVSAVSVVNVRRNRPIATVVADKVQRPSVVVAITGIRVPDCTGKTEPAGEVHPFVGAVV